MRLLLIIITFTFFGIDAQAQASCDDIAPRFSYKTSGLTVTFKNKTIGEYNKVKWEFGDGTVSEEVHPSHQFKEKGKYAFSLTVYGEGDCEHSFSGKVYVFDTKRRSNKPILSPTSKDKLTEKLNENEEKGTAKNEAATILDKNDYVREVTSYPNPFEDVTIITFNVVEQADVQVSVFDMSGQLVRQVANQKMAKGNHTFRFERNDLPSGVYLLQVTTTVESKTHKMMIQ